MKKIISSLVLGLFLAAPAFAADPTKEDLTISPEAVKTYVTLDDSSVIKYPYYFIDRKGLRRYKEAKIKLFAYTDDSQHQILTTQKFSGVRDHRAFAKKHPILNFLKNNGGLIFTVVNLSSIPIILH